MIVLIDTNVTNIGPVFVRFIFDYSRLWSPFFLKPVFFSAFTFFSDVLLTFWAVVEMFQVILWPARDCYINSVVWSSGWV